MSKQWELLKVYDEKNVMIDAHSYASNNKTKLFKSIYYHFCYYFISLRGWCNSVPTLKISVIILS